VDDAAKGPARINERETARPTAGVTHGYRDGASNLSFSTLKFWTTIGCRLAVAVGQERVQIQGPHEERRQG
jgi:hypothetical protein